MQVISTYTCHLVCAATRECLHTHTHHTQHTHTLYAPVYLRYDKVTHALLQTALIWVISCSSLFVCEKQGSEIVRISCVYARTHTRTHARTHAHTDAHTHTHTVTKHNRSRKHSNEDLNSHTKSHRTNTRTHAHSLGGCCSNPRLFCLFLVLVRVRNLVRRAHRCPPRCPPRCQPRCPPRFQNSSPAFLDALFSNSLFPWLSLE